MEDFFAVETAAGIILFEFRFMVVTEFMGGNNTIFHGHLLSVTVLSQTKFYLCLLDTFLNCFC